MFLLLNLNFDKNILKISIVRGIEHTKYMTPPIKVLKISPVKPEKVPKAIFTHKNMTALENIGKKNSKIPTLITLPIFTRQPILTTPAKSIFEMAIAKMLIDGILAKIISDKTLTIPPTPPKNIAFKNSPFA